MTNASIERAPLKGLPAWRALTQHVEQIRDVHLRSLFASDPSRGKRLAAEAAGLYLDYSKNRITDETLRLLVGLAEACGLHERIDAMFRGDKINTTEDRAVLHVALLGRGAPPAVLASPRVQSGAGARVRESGIDAASLKRARRSTQTSRRRTTRAIRLRGDGRHFSRSVPTIVAADCRFLSGIAHMRRFEKPPPSRM